MLPLYGVFFLSWEVFPLLLLFWLENVIIGIINVVKMAMVSSGQSPIWLGKVFLIPFFCFHYGIFTLVHGVFVFVLFGGVFRVNGLFPDDTLLFQALSRYHLEWALLGLVISHVISLIYNYIWHAEYKNSSLMGLMQQPYGRVIILHMTILGGGFLIMLLNSPDVGLVLLIVLKIILDVRAHLKEHSSSIQSTQVQV